MSTLKKELGTFDIFSIAAGAMISSGLFVLPAIVYTEAGPGIIISYFLAGIFFIPAVLSKCELATAMPKSGGSYFFIARSMGPLAGTLSGMANWFSVALKAAFALIGIGTFVTLFYQNVSYFEIKIIAVIFTIIFAIINILSVKLTGKIQVYLVIFLLAVLSIYSIAGIKIVNVSHYLSIKTVKLGDIFSVAGMVFISYFGATQVVTVSEEVKNPVKSIPKGMLLAFVIVMILYIFVVGVTIGILKPEVLTNTLAPISIGGEVLMGIFGLIITSLAAIVAYATTANAGIMSASRSPMAMSLDNLLPPLFGKISRKFFTPYVSIIMTSLFIISSILFLDLKNLVEMASTLVMLLFIFDNISVIIMRESKIKSYRPKFLSPLYPYLHISGILIYLFLIFEMGKIPLIITGFFLLLSIGWYFIYVKQRVKAYQYALMYITTKMSPNEIKKSTVENELRQIIVERDNIQEDRFDELIKKGKIIDLKGKFEMNQFFKYISEILSKKIKISSKKIYTLLLNRENESTTVLHPGLAIPHFIIPGKKKFVILPVRCKDGIIFPTSEIPVKTVFILAGTSDERNFHLKALMAIAQIVQSEDFEKLWLEARNEQELRSIMLLASRKRSNIINSV